MEETPPPPQVKEQPKVEKVEKPPVKEPVLTEKEIFAKKSLVIKVIAFINYKN